MGIPMMLLRRLVSQYGPLVLILSNKIKAYTKRFGLNLYLLDKIRPCFLVFKVNVIPADALGTHQRES